MSSRQGSGRPRRLRTPVGLFAALLLAGAPLAVGQFAHPPFDDRTAGGASATGGCLGGVPGADELAGLPGRLSTAVTVYTSHNRSVELDNGTTFAVIALASALGEPVDIEDILTYRDERVDVCTFDRLATLEGESVMNALALGVQAPEGELRELVVDEHVTVRFETVVDQRVELDRDIALRAIALHGSGVRVDLEDVLDIERSVRIDRTLDVDTDMERRETLLALALGGRDRDREGGDRGAALAGGFGGAPVVAQEPQRVDALEAPRLGGPSMRPAPLA